MFLTSLSLQVIGEQNYLLINPLLYRDKEYFITVSAGFDFDGVSIPRILWSLVGSPMTGGYQRSACLHDALYASQLFPRDVCDKIFYEAMKAEGVNKIKAYTLYKAVRIGGYFAYKSKDEIEKYQKLVTVSYI